MKRYIVCLCVISVLSWGSVASSCSESENGLSRPVNAASIAFIPQPQSVIYDGGGMVVPSSVSVSDELTGGPYALLESTVTSLGGELVRQSGGQAFIRLVANASLQDEEYKIKTTLDGITLEYASSRGLLWGVQTLRQMLLQSSAYEGGGRVVPLLTLSDKPEKSWRGFHIDVARHAFTIDYLKKVIDMLSFYKINKLQMHLTDDQGWRMEIKRYPELTTIGAWREFDEYDKRCQELAQTDASFVIDTRFIRNNSEYGGYYTQEELSQLVAYASERGIEIIPEIDMPGHFSAAIRAFPSLSCTNEAGWGTEFSYPICVGKPETYEFLKNILDEVLSVFPSEYIHIGADEVEKDNWKSCPYCQQMIRDKGLVNVTELQNYFVEQMSDYVKSKGRKVMAWDDAFYKNRPLDLLYTYWRDWESQQPADITQSGHPLIFMEWGRFYLSGNSSDESLKSLYEFTFEPQFPGIVQSQVQGFQACVWTEMIPNERKFGQHVFPACQAFSEVAWGSKRDWSRFTKNLPWHLQWLTRNGLHYRTPGFIK